MQIMSPAFGNNESIPSKYTCDEENVNPELRFLEVPSEAKSLVLFMDDPDVPKHLKPDGMFDHWVIYNIDPSVNVIPENAPPPGTVGLNSSGRAVYAGACPPDRVHRYFFKLYALDTQLAFEDETTVTKADVEEAMQGHIIEKAELIGLYERS